MTHSFSLRLPRPRGIHIALLAALAALAAAGGNAQAASLSIATYNIHHAAGADNVVDLDRIAGVMSGLDAQIIGLQENDMANGRTGFVHQPNELAARMTARTGSVWQALSAPAINYQGGQYGNAILFDTGALGLQSFKVLALPDPAGDGARSAGLAVFDLAGTRFQFATTHLTHRNQPSQTVPGSTVQVDSMNLIDAAIDRTLPAVINGDFNAGPASASMAHWQQLGWRIDSPTDVPTLDGGTQAIDFNTSLGADAWQVTGNRVVTGGLAAVASDHFPVVTTYNIPAVPEPGTYALMLCGAGVLAAVARRRPGR